MGVKRKPVVTIDRYRLQSEMSRRGYRSYSELAHELHVTCGVEDVSESSILRWNREGWPRHKYRALCSLFGTSMNTV